MSEEVKRKISEATKRRWELQRKAGMASGRALAPGFTLSGKLKSEALRDFACKVCGELPTPGYRGSQHSMQRWLDRHTKREHGGPPSDGRIPGVVEAAFRAKYNRALELNKQGLGNPVIANKVGVNLSTVQRWLKAGRKSVAVKVGGARPHTTGHPEHIRRKALQMLKAHPEFSQGEVARRIGVHPSAINRWAKGGKAGGSSEAATARSGWGNMTPSERSAEMVRRMKVRAAKKAAREAAASNEPEPSPELKANGSMGQQLGT